MRSKIQERIKDLNIIDIIHMYDIEKLGMPTIQRKYHISQRDITQILKDNNIEIRDKTWVLKNRPPFKGYKYTEKKKQEIREKAFRAYKNDPNLKDRIRQKTLKQISEGRMPKSNTNIEKIMTNLLTDLGLSFEYQKVFAYWCFDFYLPKYDLFIE